MSGAAEHEALYKSEAKPDPKAKKEVPDMTDAEVDVFAIPLKMTRHDVLDQFDELSKKFPEMAKQAKEMKDARDKAAKDAEADKKDDAPKQSTAQAYGSAKK